MDERQPGEQQQEGRFNWRQRTAAWADDGCKEDDDLADIVSGLAELNSSHPGKRVGEHAEFDDVVSAIDRLRARQIHAEVKNTYLPSVIHEELEEGSVAFADICSLHVCPYLESFSSQTQSTVLIEMVDLVSREIYEYRAHISNTDTYADIKERQAQYVEELTGTPVRASQVRHLEYDQADSWRPVFYHQDDERTDCLRLAIDEVGWEDIVASWEAASSSNTSCQILFDGISELAKQPLPGLPNRNWRDTGEFGDIVRHLHNVCMPFETLRGGVSDAEEYCQRGVGILLVFARAPDASPSTVLHKLKEEFP